MTEPRAARPTVRFIDEYCDSYKSLFPEVRSFEAFKQLHVGLVSEIKRKTLPNIAQVVGLENSQSLHHFITASPWEAKELRERRQGYGTTSGENLTAFSLTETSKFATFEK
jgi:SRSO17 transposase